MVLVALQVRRPILLVHPTAKDTSVLDPQASDASVDPDAVRLAAGRPARCPVAVLGSLQSASVDAPEPKAVSPLPEQPPLDAPTKVVFRFRFRCLAQRLDQNAAREFPPPNGAPELQLERNSR
jgi:hypothetical protein